MQIPIFASLVLNFNPRPPRGGRLQQPAVDRNHQVFQSTPSARRATAPFQQADAELKQFQSTPSARRATRDGLALLCAFKNFNPRPPRGERRTPWSGTTSGSTFQSTPSARRATLHCLTSHPANRYFNPRPPRGERPGRPEHQYQQQRISIHALREESDPNQTISQCATSLISIHALREESDDRPGERNRDRVQISIHALREESDFLQVVSMAL